MARKVTTIQDIIETNEEFEDYLVTNYDKLICLEVYSEFCGYCLATVFAIRKGKLDLGKDSIVMARKGKLTRACFGANGIELCRIIEEELDLTLMEVEKGVERVKHEIGEPLPEETAKVEEEIMLEEEMREAREKLRVVTVAARKKRIAERLSMYKRVQQLDFILFWPHSWQAHYDLYEKWDALDIQVAAKEEIQMTEESVREVLYMSDVEPNEACLYALLNGPALAVLFKMFERDNRNFVQLMRYTLYEELPVPKEDQSLENFQPIPAYERYASVSKSAREVRRERYDARVLKRAQEKEERQRLAAERARLKKEAEEDRLRLEKQKEEEERMARIQAGLPADPESEETAEGEENVGEEQKPEAEANEEAEPEAKAEVEAEVEPGVEDIVEEEEEEFHSDVEVEGEEYIPPGGLFVPGLYSPPNDLAKANGLAFLFPKVISEITAIESEYLPAHYLFMFTIDKRHEVQEVMRQIPDDILNYGIFVGDDPSTAQHVAYTIKQYDKMQRPMRHKDRLALMVSRKSSIPMLQLAGLNPLYISQDEVTGERECLTMFPVGYGDDYVEVESIKEEEQEIQDVPAAADSVTAANEELQDMDNVEKSKEDKD